MLKNIELKTNTRKPDCCSQRGNAETTITGLFTLKFTAEKDLIIKMPLGLWVVTA
jgi:hypothetical protein